MTSMQYTTEDSPHGGDSAKVHEVQDVAVSTADTDFAPNRVFINNLDSYHSKQLCAILSDKLYGGNKNEKELGEELGETEQQQEQPEEQEEEEENASIGILDRTQDKMKYEIIGTAKTSAFTATEDILFIVDGTDRARLADEIFKCGTVVFDVTLDPAEVEHAREAIEDIDKTLTELEETAPKKYAESNEQRVFVLLSTVLTWANTRPPDPDDPDVALTEADFRKRRPHPNYKDHIELEKQVLQIGKKHPGKLQTVVVGCGVTYGGEESHLHGLFRMAWSNAPYLPVIEPANNTIPVIHIKDLVSIVCGIIAEPPSKKYILAVEQTPCTQKQITTAISKNLGSGRVQVMSQASALLFDYIDQPLLDCLSLNIRMEPGYIVDEMEIEWQSEQNLAENIKKIVAEYKESRKLAPVRILLHGPPAVGKTTLAQKLIKHYHLHYISVSTLASEAADTIAENMKYISEQIKQRQQGAAIEKDEEDETDDEEDLDAQLDELKQKFNEIQSTLEASPDNNVPDTFIIQLIKERLRSNPCQNQGYILDGYPETAQQAQDIFGITGDAGMLGEMDEEDEDDDEKEVKSTKILPEFVISLQASDEFLYRRVMAMPESSVQGTAYNEHDMVRNLRQFRQNNDTDYTVLNVFDEIEIHPIVLIAESDDAGALFTMVQEKIGPERGYPPSDQELELERLREQAQRQQERELANILKMEEEQKAREAQAESLFTWMETMQKLVEEEEAWILAESQPVREYLVQWVFPTLTRGLAEAARVRPADPIDFLAEYLFKQNPDGRMFDPAYTASADDLFHSIKEFEEQLGLL